MAEVWPTRMSFPGLCPIPRLDASEEAALAVSRPLGADPGLIGPRQSLEAPQKGSATDP